MTGAAKGMREAELVDCQEALEMRGGPAWIRTRDPGIMSPDAGTPSKEDTPLSSAESGKLQQNQEPPRNQKGGVM